MKQKHSQKLLSDQVDSREIEIILRELNSTLASEISGDVVEFGCYVGTTSVFLARRLSSTDRKLYLYDSFAGLPEKSAQDSSPAGTQFVTGELLATKKQLVNNLKKSGAPMPIIKKSWFSQLESSDLPDKICFAFLDGDYYQSILDSLSLIWPKLENGAIIVVDDYANEQLPGAAKAVNEWLASHAGKLVRVEHSLAIIRR